MTTYAELETQFPRETMERVLGEASCWTRSTAVISAGRMIEAASQRESTHFILAFPDDSVLEAVLVSTFAFVVPNFRVPAAAISMAALLAPELRASTLASIADIRLNPTISVSPAGASIGKLPLTTGGNPLRILVVEDSPPAIEVAFEPFRMLHLALLGMYDEARKLRELDLRARETSDSDTSIIFHKHLGDGAMIAALDALIYFAFGFRIGLQWGEQRGSIETNFRYASIVGQPPLRPELFDSAKASFSALMQSIDHA